MNETTLFNNDVMYWREINFSSPDATAELELIEPMTIEGDVLSIITCSLLPFEAQVVEYEIENDGGSFTKNEVKEWPFVLITDVAFYNDEGNPEQERKAKLITVPHTNVQSITLKDKAGNVILKKGKI